MIRVPRYCRSGHLAGNHAAASGVTSLMHHGLSVDVAQEGSVCGNSRRLQVSRRAYRQSQQFDVPAQRVHRTSVIHFIGTRTLPDEDQRATYQWAHRERTPPGPDHPHRSLRNPSHLPEKKARRLASPTRKEQDSCRNALEVVMFPASHPASRFAAVWVAERVGFEPTCRNYPTIRFRVGAVMTTSVPLQRGTLLADRYSN